MQQRQTIVHGLIHLLFDRIPSFYHHQKEIHLIVILCNMMSMKMNRKNIILLNRQDFQHLLFTQLVQHLDQMMNETNIIEIRWKNRHDKAEFFSIFIFIRWITVKQKKERIATVCFVFFLLCHIFVVLFIEKNIYVENFLFIEHKNRKKESFCSLNRVESKPS